ncbi:MAG: hypothetical protein A2014_01100 [Spirochaetes bacterium GWF1_49_6]|nr:MAG: hypothetical protein A2014_01100 [Spirochaetes bacterium GWF1_49_6]
MKKMSIVLVFSIVFSTVLFSELLSLKDDGYSINIPTNYQFRQDENSLSILLNTPGTEIGISKSWLPWKEIQAGVSQAYIKEANLMMFKTEVSLENEVTHNSIVFHNAELKKFNPKNPDYAIQVYTSYFQTKKGVYRIVFESAMEIYPYAIPEVKSLINSIEKLK